MSATRSTRTSWVRGSETSTTSPSGAMTPVTPFVDATAVQRPVSIARSRVMANCWSIWSVRMNVALLVCTTSSSAPRETWALMPSSYATSKQIASATGTPPMSSGSSRVPVSMSRPTSRSRSKKL